MAAAAERQVQYHRRRHFAPRHGLSEGRSTGWPTPHPLHPGSDALCGGREIAGPRLEAIQRAGGGGGEGGGAFFTSKY
ncbi:C-Jun-amino-terminal kinase-interacting protein 3 isoform X1 [Lates japonicus]|uniref:C-Jun-amino-terminal kinase-interacting protein 3 isoform X1 n=1 Tax=Lates japonicus TaxID=270547 RepID=A0AAD3R9C5_LATJO|nr:C-Jun-amino-terminal kinase-interacting protein 3 isoform X1 [Lates japonicus]